MMNLNFGKMLINLLSQKLAKCSRSKLAYLKHLTMTTRLNYQLSDIRISFSLYKYELLPLRSQTSTEDME